MALFLALKEGSQLQAERFNEVLHVDFCSIDVSDTGHMCVLTMKDGLSQYARLVCAKDETGVTAAVIVMQWIADFGVPLYLVSDGGPHFKNTLMEALANELQFSHHITLAHSAWANGSVERLNRSMLSVHPQGFVRIEVGAFSLARTDACGAVYAQHHTFAFVGRQDAVGSCLRCQHSSSATLCFVQGTDVG